MGGSKVIFFDIAAYWHKIFSLYVEAVLKYVSSSEEAGEAIHDVSSCYLGKWMSGAGSCFSLMPEFQQLNIIHSDFHDFATDAIQAANEKRSSAAWLSQTINTLRQSSFTVIEALATLDAAIATESVVNQDTTLEIDCPISKFKLGVSVIDDQHQALAALAQRLMENPSVKFSDQDNAELVTQLAALTALHFKTEEIYMRSIQLPPLELKKHMAEHQRIVDSLFLLSESTGHVEQLTTADLKPKFTHWFTNHLIDYDYSLKRF
jgi:hemerythrin-like metal-binding protein